MPVQPEVQPHADSVSCSAAAAALVILKLADPVVSQAQILDCLQLAAHLDRQHVDISHGNMFLVVRILAEELDTVTIIVKMVADAIS
jgi:hypothetical protein